MQAPTPSSILVVDDEPGILALVKDILVDEGYEVDSAQTAESARASRRNRRPDLVLLDIWLPDSDGISLLREWSESGAGDSPVIMMSGHGTVETAVEATRLGAYDFLEKPLSTAKLLLAVRRALEAAELRQENIGLKREAFQAPEPIGRSTVMNALRDRVKRIAEHDTPVLITGESGSERSSLRAIFTPTARVQADLSSACASPALSEPQARPSSSERRTGRVSNTARSRGRRAAHCFWKTSWTWIRSFRPASSPCSRTARSFASTAPLRYR